MKLRLTKSLVVVALLSSFAIGQQAQISTLAPASVSSSPGAAPAPQTSDKKSPASLPKHKIGPFEVTINWRTRAEGWNWFEGNTGNSDYPLWQSLLRIGIGQTRSASIGSPKWNNRPFSASPMTQ